VVPAKGTTKVEVSPNQAGVAFYPVFLLDMEGIPITQYGPAITVRVDEKKVNRANIPELEAIATGFAYIKIDNASNYSLAFHQGNSELAPLDRDATILNSGESAAYQIEPQDAGAYRFMRNTSSPIPFPQGIQEFVKDTIYSFRYDGTLLTLISKTPLLPAPQNIVVEVGDSRTTVKWDTVPRVSSYNVYYSTGETPPERPAQSGITETTVTISGLVNETTYYVWVESVNAEGSTMSEAKTISLTLQAPQNIVVEPGKGSITVKWDAVSRAGSYNLYYSTSQTVPERPVQSGITGTTATISGLVSNTTYYVWLASVNAGGSTVSGAKTISLTLQAPQNIVVEAGNGSITVKWDGVPLASSYNLYYSTGQTVPETPSQSGITGTAATISGLTNGAAYYVWVASVNAGGSTVSAPSSIRLLFYVATSQEFSAAIAAINAASEATTYTIILTNSISAGNVTFTANVVKAIIIKGTGAIRTVTNTGTAALFTVPAGITLLLDNNLLLNGNNKSASAVTVDGGALVMNPGSRISAAKDSGIRIRNNGTFTMEGGEISGNTAASSYCGGGVYVGSGIFIKRGGGTIDATNQAEYGKVAYVYSGSKARNTAAGPNVNLDSSKSGSAGGWE
jgi:hypothetical protein